MARSALGFIVFACLTLRLWAQEFPTMVVQLVGKGYIFTEGPAWSKEGFLIFSDTSSNKLWKWSPGSDPAVFRDNANGPSGNAFDNQGRLYTCETHARRVTRTTMKDGRVEVVAESWE